MKPDAAAGRYARALAEIAGENDAKALEALTVEIELLAATAGSDPALLRFFDSPSANAADKTAAAASLAKQAGLSDLAARFFKVLVENRRVGALKGIAAALEERRDRAANIVPAEATFATEPGPAEEKAIQQALEKMTGSRVRLSVKVDPDLLGGAVARVGSRIYDGSLRTRLQSLHRLLARA
ncbi:MAG TPA: ATP synthase F1 subunit delta [Candidatus Polarisedimenticolia bacterium]|nr:ATP synthase F1 subunit delta [Candidatus Polarisedimenticolia bacterium]